MQRWRPAWKYACPSWLRYRAYHARSLADHVKVPCASAGEITVSLHNLPAHSPSAPLVVWIPPFSPHYFNYDDPPDWLARYPTAVIKYRWKPKERSQHENDAHQHGLNPPLSWPAPLHDTLFGYSWLIKNLAPPDNCRRDVYICSSHLGASIATAIALTESHQHQAMAVRGLAVYNGIYDWTTFLPDHPLHQKGNQPALALRSAPKTDSMLDCLEQDMSAYFSTPADLFDPFASPCLFFHSAPLWPPREFGQSHSTPARTEAVDKLLERKNNSGRREVDGPTATTKTLLSPPRKTYLPFPPLLSTLKIPQTLLLHESAPSAAGWRRWWKQRPSAKRHRPDRENSFTTQALNLAAAMRRSITNFELPECQTDEEYNALMQDARRRVQVVDVGEPEHKTELRNRGQKVLLDWLEERISLDEKTS